MIPDRFSPIASWIWAVSLVVTACAHKPPTPPPLVKVVEVRQRSVTEDPAVRGDFPNGWLVATPERLPQPPPHESELVEFKEMLERTQAPRVVEETLAPGAPRTVELQLSGPSGLAGSTRWVGTSRALTVTIALDGSSLATGKAYRTSGNRGGANVVTQTTGGGRAAMSVTNTTDAPVKVRMLLMATPR